jgi:hypothetical protein
LKWKDDYEWLLNNMEIFGHRLIKALFLDLSVRMKEIHKQIGTLNVIISTATYTVGSNIYEMKRHKRKQRCTSSGLINEIH